MEQIQTESLKREIESLKKIVINMQENLDDCLCTSKEAIIFDKARQDLEKGETVSLEKLEEDLNAD